MSLINSWPFLSFHLLLFDPKMADASRKENDNEEKKTRPFFLRLCCYNKRTHAAAGSSHTSQWANKEGVAHPPKVPIVGYTVWSLCDHTYMYKWWERRKVAIFFGWWDFPIQNTDGTGIVLRICIVRLFCVCVLLFLVKDFHSLMSFLFSVLSAYVHVHTLSFSQINTHWYRSFWRYIEE